MKCIELLVAFVILIVFAAVLSFGQEYTQTLPADGRSFVVVPTRSLTDAPTWGTTTVYQCGQYVKHGANYYMLVTSNGTSGAYSTNAPTHLRNDATPDYKGLTWRRVPTRPRGGAVIQLVSGGPVWCAEGSSATVGKGFLLATTNATLTYAGQGEISCAAQASSVITVGESEQ